MESLKSVNLTPEQRKLALNTKPMNRVIRGAAGSGKTTSALFLLKVGLLHYKTMKRRIGDTTPIRAVVITFNKTLKSYVESLAKEIADDIEVEVVHLAKYMMDHYPYYNERLLRITPRQMNIPIAVFEKSPLSYEHTLSEIEYILGRYCHTELEQYIEVESPNRTDEYLTNRDIRRDIIEYAIKPYRAYKESKNFVDLNDLAQYFIENKVDSFEVLIVDECQDFSANDLRAIINQLSEDSFGTFVIDTAQKIYKRTFTWREVGLNIRPENSFRLSTNYRNTKEIAHFATSLLTNIRLDQDSTLPNNSDCEEGGTLPTVFEGKFSEQLNFAVRYIKDKVNLQQETVAFLHRKGYGCFRFLREVLIRENLPFCEITSQSCWPEGTQNIALSTLHSAKGLEFDHVFMLGLEDEHFNYINHGDDGYQESCRLVAMGITRAKKTVTLGYKLQTKPLFMDDFNSDSYQIEKAL
ncbi:TPA: 3'-5' exonuclease [Photobacterium damselae]